MQQSHKFMQTLIDLHKKQYCGFYQSIKQSSYFIFTNTYCRLKNTLYFYCPQKMENHPLKTKKITIKMLDKKAFQTIGQKKAGKTQSPHQKSSNLQQNMTYFNFFKSKNKKCSRKIEKEKQSQQGTQKEQFKQLQQLWQVSSQKSQVGSEYGDHNYDKELKEFISKNKMSEEQRNRPKNIQGNESTLTNKRQILFGSKLRKFQKSKTQTQSKGYTPAGASLNSIHDRQGEQKDQIQNNKFNKTDMKFYLDIYKQDQMENQNGSLSSVDKQTFFAFSKILNLKGKGQHVQEKKCSKDSLRPYHHVRSKTQEQLIHIENDNSEQIFQKYHKVKQNLRKPSDTYRGTKTRQKYPNPNLQRQEHKIAPELSKIHSLQNSRNCQTKSLKKYGIVPIYQNVCKMGNSKSGICFSPMNNLNDSIEQINLRKLIKARQKNFFQKINPHGVHGVEANTFTFEQIKSRLQKIQHLEYRKKNSRQFTPLNLNAISTAMLNNEPKICASSYSSKVEDQSSQYKDVVIKYKEIKFKAKLMQKHTDFYGKYKKKAAMQGYLQRRNSSKNIKIKV